VVVNSGPIESEEIESSCGVRMLQIGWEHELEDVVDRYLRADVGEFGWLFRNGKQEDVSFLVRSLGIVTTPEAVTNCILAEDTSQARLVVGQGGLRLDFLLVLGVFRIG